MSKLAERTLRKAYRAVFVWLTSHCSGEHQACACMYLAIG